MAYFLDFETEVFLLEIVVVVVNFNNVVVFVKIDSSVINFDVAVIVDNNYVVVVVVAVDAEAPAENKTNLDLLKTLYFCFK